METKTTFKKQQQEILIVKTFHLKKEKMKEFLNSQEFETLPYKSIS